MPQINENSWFIMIMIFSFFYLFLLVFMYFWDNNLYYSNKMNFISIFYFKMFM